MQEKLLFRIVSKTSDWKLKNAEVMANCMYANLAKFRVLLKSLGGYVALDKVDQAWGGCF